MLGCFVPYRIDRVNVAVELIQSPVVEAFPVIELSIFVDVK